MTPFGHDPQGRGPVRGRVDRTSERTVTLRACQRAVTQMCERRVRRGGGLALRALASGLVPACFVATVIDRTVSQRGDGATHTRRTPRLCRRRIDPTCCRKHAIRRKTSCSDLISANADQRGTPHCAACPANKLGTDCDGRTHSVVPRAPDRVRRRTPRATRHRPTSPGRGTHGEPSENQ